MIKAADVAKQVSDLMIEFGGRLNDSVSLVQERGSAQDFEKYRQAISAVMAEMLLEVMNPLCLEHPALKPEEMK